MHGVNRGYAFLWVAEGAYASPWSRRHQAVAASHILWSRNQSYLRD